MSTKNLAWGVTGGVSLLLALACGGEKIRDVGDVDGGGTGGLGTAGTGTGGFDTAGTGMGGYGTAGTGMGGYTAGCGNIGFEDICNTGGFGTAGTGMGGFDTAGTSMGGFGTAGSGSAGGVGGAPADCFAPAFVEQPPTVAPQNVVFVDSRTVAADTVRNSADQQVFLNSGPVSEAYANFSASPAAADTAILLPAQLSQVADNLGQFYVTRPDCAGKPAAGRKLTVEFWWKLGGAVGVFPTHGVALGTVSSKGKAVWYEDSAKTFVVGEAQSKRLMNTLNKLVVQHTFAEDDAADAGKVTLGVWLLPDAELASTLYMGRVTWE